MRSKHYLFILALLGTHALAVSQGETWQSEKVHYNQEGKLEYSKDAEGNIIPDFSYAGYKNDGLQIPDVEIVKTISPIAGDNTHHIQQAIDEVAALSMNSKGIRGALLLKAGTYEVHGTIRINHSGVILRGEGDGENPASNTVIIGIGNIPRYRSVLVAGGGENTQWPISWGSRASITTDLVPLGAMQFEVDDASEFKVGDNVLIHHPCTKNWLEAVDYGGVAGATHNTWYVGQIDIKYNRYITDIEGNTVSIDVPVYYQLDRSISQCYMWKFNNSRTHRNIGIENLRVDIETSGELDYEHARNAIELCQIEDSWVKESTMLHFSGSGIITNTASRISILDCRAIDPKGPIRGGLRYNFNMYTASQQILIYDCFASNGRHNYVSNGESTVSGIAVVDCESSKGYTADEAHRKWSQGILFDNLNVVATREENEGGNRIMGFYNRGLWADGHGWAAVHSVMWNCDPMTRAIIVQKPPTGQNYAIGCKGIVTGKKPNSAFEAPEGYIEGNNKKGLLPRSLFEAQYKDRTGKDFNPVYK